MNFLFYLAILLVYLSSGEILPSLAKKLKQKQSSPLLELIDKEVHNILEKSKDEWLVLFYDSDFPASNILINAWKRMAIMLENEDYLINIGTVDLRQNNTSAFSRLKLYRFPCAIVIKGGFYYNYTGTLDYYSIMNLVKNQTYYSYTQIPVPPPFGYIDLAKLFVKALTSDNFETRMYLLALGAIIIFSILVWCRCLFYRTKEEEEEELKELKDLKED
ncbi:unnamed protein product [Blepharisma stoltei]|uniref:Thioredoxin domain-containing protein n=1 Tax=Blepharisma stoltei TaxID=1481888 RepID=A0AAU9KAB1_9CILI|nr:unnamed protein product [Blepharisma stoltei]